MAQYLYSRDSKGKVRVLIVTMFKVDEHYEIRSKAGLLGGKLTDAPTKVIAKGKVKRTILEQVELEMKSLINTKRDRGYKMLQELTTEELDWDNYAAIDELLPKDKTYASGLKKLMLAKDPKKDNKYVNQKTGEIGPGWKKDWWVSKKLDGIRAAVGFDKVYTSISRSGKCLDVAFTEIFKLPELKRIHKAIGLDKMLDGELYIHGKSLQTLAGLAALKEWDADRQGGLEFWIFDYADETSTAEERALLLNSLQDKLPEGSKIKINAQVKLKSYETIKKLHDTFVQSGFEGAICRDALALYGFGSRDDRMIKVKEFQDDEFEIIGEKLGLRGAEDMVFRCITPDGKEFEAKPMGDRSVKIAYHADMVNLIGKFVTIKFFNYTADGIPFLPVAVVVRDYE